MTDGKPADSMDAPLLNLSESDLAQILGLSSREAGRSEVHLPTGDQTSAFEPVDGSGDALLSDLFGSGPAEAAAVPSVTEDAPGEVPSQPAPPPSETPAADPLPVAEANGSELLEAPPSVALDDPASGSVSTPLLVSPVALPSSELSPARQEAPAREAQVPPPRPAQPSEGFEGDDEICEFAAVRGRPGFYRMRLQRVVGRPALEGMLQALEATSAEPDAVLRQASTAALARASIYRRVADRLEAGLSLTAALQDIADGAPCLAPLSSGDMNMLRRWVDGLKAGDNLAFAASRDAGPAEVDFLHVRGRASAPNWPETLRELADRLLRGVA